MKKIIILTLLLAVSGCAAFSERRDLRNDYYQKYEYSVQENYENIYQKLLEKVRNRYLKYTGISFNIVIDNDIYSDSKTAVIRGSLWTELFGEQKPLLIDIKAIADNETKIIAYIGKTGLHPSIKKEDLDKWILN